MRIRLTINLVHLVCFLSIANAQLEPLDPTFNDSGKVYTSFNETSRGTKVAVQADGKIVVVGVQGHSSKWVVARYLDNGSPDSTFGMNGVIPELMSDGEPYILHVLDNGNILICGQANFEQSYSVCDVVLIQLLPNGTVDTSFGQAGKVFDRIDPIRRNIPSAILVTGQRITVVGSTSGGVSSDTGMRGFLTRYYRDGSRDSIFFGNKGVVLFRFDYDKGAVRDAALTYDSRIVTLCIEHDGVDDSRITMRYFQWDGSQDIPSAPPNPGYKFHPSDRVALYKTRDDGLIVAGPVDNPGPINLLVAVRMKPDGTKDPTFSFDPITIGSSYLYNTAIVERQDKDLFFALSGTNKDRCNFLIKCRSNGTLDTSFGNKGVVTPSLAAGYSESGPAIAADSSNKILVAGGLHDGSSYGRIQVKRYIDKPSSNVEYPSTDRTPLTIYPHPFTNKFTLRYDLQTAGQTSCELYSLGGRLLTTLFSSYRSSGGHIEELIFNESIRPGAYILRLNTPSGSLDLQVIKQ